MEYLSAKITSIAGLNYWEKRGCNTDYRVINSDKLTTQYLQDIIAFSYNIEEFIYSFAQFSLDHGNKVFEVFVGACTNLIQWVCSRAKAYELYLTKERTGHVKAQMRLEGLQAASLKRANAEEQPCEYGYFDIAYGWGVIHHANNMENCLAKLVRTTKCGGKINILVHNWRSFFTLTKLILYGWMRGKFFKGFAVVLHFHMENHSTECYIPTEIQRMAQKFDCEVEVTDLNDKRGRKGARFERIRRLIHTFIPKQSLFYMGINMCHKSEV
jgi:hypothetical protein